ncbi:AraC-like ligand binding domain-containing protein [Ligilactobacillus sp. WC1T17]|uniref:AraC-like ligand binding domain-containing protein n=1 Tax=Ligilactobacillus ruminis TaxID=1623 RepID=A0ABY1AEX0_9LACO|nr:AraC-like ligand binding domain-containing protein [Ligilactobacillus ruminis]
MALSKDQSVPQHHVDATVVVILVNGKVEFSQADGSFEVLTPGKIVYMQPDEKHALEEFDLIIVKIQLAK